MSRLSQQGSSSPCKGSKYLRNRSSDEFLIEELSPDDMGYDADIETIKPDKYEDVESESEGMVTPDKNWESIDEELAARMRQLGKNQLSPVRSSSNRGRKRMSIEMADGDTLLGGPCSPDIEIHEVVDNTAPSPAKRRRKKSRHRSAAQYTLQGQNEVWTDSSGRGEGNGRGKGVTATSTSSATSEQARPKNDEDDDDEMMDVA